MTDTTSPKPFVFVLMPFAKEYDDIYKLGIKEACKNADAYCERVDEQIFTGSILDRIYNQIAKADLIISDMTGRNPNVFYETGYAHALGKEVILLTQNADDIPFDMKHYPHIVYHRLDIASLNDEVKRRVQWFIDNPTKKLRTVDFSLEYYFNGKRLNDPSNISNKPINVGGTLKDSIYIVDFQFEIHNPTKQTLNLLDCQSGLIGPWITGMRLDILSEYIAAQKNLPIIFKISPKERIINLPNKSMFIFPLPSRLLPNGWETLSCRLALNKPKRKTIACKIRTFTEVSTNDTSIIVEFEKPIMTIGESK
jgi:hypothetical protein